MAVTAIPAAELKYAQCIATVDLVCKDEELRKARLANVLLNHDCEDAHAKQVEETARADLAQQQAEHWQDIAQDHEQKLGRQEALSAAKSRELDHLKAELSSLKTVSSDSTNILTEKLALSRELASLRPELEDLRAQVAANEGLFAEKLSLKRQLATCQVELQDARRDLQKTESKEEKHSSTNAIYRKEISDLEKQLAKERRERQKAEQVKQKNNNDELDDLRRELASAKQGRQAAEQAASTLTTNDTELVNLNKDLATERLERQKAERLLAKSEAEWDAQKAILDDKLDQFRTKLRTTKESLKQAQAELDRNQTVPQVIPIDSDTTSTKAMAATKRMPKNSRKRNAQQMDPDAAIGTPGDAARNKRARRTTTTLVGEKSNFSITPFLNRRTSVAPHSSKDVDTQEADEPVETVETVDSPSVQNRDTSRAKKQKTALAPSSPSKSNLKVTTAAPGAAQKKPAARTTLEQVAEEDEVDPDASNNNEPTETTKIVLAPPTTNTQPVKPARLSLKPKALSSFATFREGSQPPQQMQKKKRKLLGGAAKTLFDEDDEADADSHADIVGGGKPATAGQRAFGAFGSSAKLLGKKGIGMLGGVKKKGPLVVANDGFMFSPLKKDRKNMVAANA